jgi:acyl-CoA synthetase (AMP-forming)/AMP-acid ligase II
MGSIEYTPAYGRRLVPVAVDDFAAEQPDKIFAYFPKSSNVKDGFINVTYSALARAIDRTAWWLEERLGGRSTTFETLAYIGPSDLRYTILMVAAVKTGYKVSSAILLFVELPKI